MLRSLKRSTARAVQGHSEEIVIQSSTTVSTDSSFEGNGNARQPDNHPYSYITNDFVVAFEVVKGNPPRRPSQEECPHSPMSDEVWSITRQCWAIDPANRPTMPAVYELLNTLAESSDGT